eukprot:TRINITY_DN6031_c0_g1_i1.p1 TRINITY_DN6031_c0_g1~~TRINITY_DN6031_c0_g1_i1.p1  ORF type:complete len:269 (-),score=70.96 TRINITY_DN6031_c0_g1_i1:103-795(-)
MALLLGNLITSQRAQGQLMANRSMQPHAMVGTFEAKRPASISLEAYVSRLAQYSGAPPSLFAACCCYVDRIIEHNPTFIVSDNNIYRVLLACLVIAEKFFLDFYFSNEFLARVGGVPNEELNNLEVSVLALLSFELYIPDDLFSKYEAALATAAAHCQRQREAAALAQRQKEAMERPFPFFFSDSENPSQMFVWCPASGVYSRVSTPTGEPSINNSNVSRPPSAEPALVY